jgi:D-3-phosphoglycerate dehydrogenase
MIQGIPLEAHLEGTLLYLRNDDKPGVIGQVGSTLGQLGVNIATFALGRSSVPAPPPGSADLPIGASASAADSPFTSASAVASSPAPAHAVSLVRVDGEVSASILDPIRAIPAITEARLLRL